MGEEVSEGGREVYPWYSKCLCGVFPAGTLSWPGDTEVLQRKLAILSKPKV